MPLEAVPGAGCAGIVPAMAGLAAPAGMFIFPIIF
jgi:hypothetical protein